VPETPLLLPRALSFLRSRDLMLYVIGGLITGVVGWLPRGFVRRSDWASSFGHQSWAAFPSFKGGTQRWKLERFQSLAIASSYSQCKPG